MNYNFNKYKQKSKSLKVRVMWEFNPVTRIVKPKKGKLAYSRQQFKNFSVD